MADMGKGKKDMTPRDLVNNLLQYVTQEFYQHKGIQSTFIFIKNANQTEMPVQLGNEIHKNNMDITIKDLVRRSEPDAVVFISEGWTRELVNSPTELVVVHIEFKTGEKFGCTAQITRADKLLLGQFEVHDAANDMGLFMDFYPHSLN
jgi:hypothetical protein